LFRALRKPATMGLPSINLAGVRWRCFTSRQ
jgi:hypothetical protein